MDHEVRLANQYGERRFSTWTYGVQYRHNAATHILLNYEYRMAQAPGLPQDNLANQNLHAMDDMVGIQVVRLF